MTQRIQRDIVSAIIFSRDGMLFQGRKDPLKGGVYTDAWHLPGGGIEQGESKETALIREVKEETGIDISSYRIECVDDVGRGQAAKTMDDGQRVLCDMTFTVYKVFIPDRDADQIKVVLSDDLVDYAWRTVSDLKTIVLTPPSRALFKRLGYL